MMKTVWGIVIAIALIVSICVIWSWVNNVSYEKNIATEITLMRNGLLIEVFKRRSGGYPSPGFSGQMTELPELAELWQIAEASHARFQLSTSDAWGNELLYVSAPDGGSYTLVSPGGDGKPDRRINLLAPEYQTISSYSQDVVFHNGRFYRWWAGWCCNPAYQDEESEALEERLRSGRL